MHRLLLPSLFALSFFVGAAGVAPAAHAAGVGAVCTDVSMCDAGLFCSPDTGTCVAQGQEAAAQAQAQQEVINATSGNPAQVKLGQDDAPTGFSTIMIWIMTLFAWLVGVAAITLDNAVYYTVVTMGQYVNNLSAVGVTWRILRDMGNIMLIFGFLAVGITTILNVDWYGGGKKMLPMMLVAAVFLNFSLFFAEAIIDTGNLFATQFYTQINGGKPAGAKNFDLTSINNDGISNKIMQQVGLQSIYGDAMRNGKVLLPGNSWVIGFMAIILFIITAFVMFSLAFVLIARFIILLFLIILAPIGFAGLAVPQLARRAKQWWDKLFEQVVTAPILLLMLYVALTIITDVHFLTGFCIPSAGSPNTACAANWTGFASGNLTGFASMVLSFLVAMGLLLAVVIQSKNLSAFGAEWASKTAGKLTFGLTAAGMRTTAGWGLNSAAKRFRSSKLARVPILGRSVAGVLDKGAKGSFDIRGIETFGGLKAANIDAGKPQVGGYRKTLEEAIRGREEHAKTLESTKAEKAAIPAFAQAAAAATRARELNDTAQTRQAEEDAKKAHNRAQNAAQIGYAKGLQTMPWGILTRNSKAADNIIKAAEKSKDQKEIDALLAALRNAAQPPPPPPPAAPAGRGPAHP